MSISFSRVFFYVLLTFCTSTISILIKILIRPHFFCVAHIYADVHLNILGQYFFGKILKYFRTIFSFGKRLLGQ